MTPLLGAWVVIIAAIGGWLSKDWRGHWGTRITGWLFMLVAWALGVFL